MKRLAVVVVSSVLLCGCVAVVIQKEVQVKKDANGNVIETIETERATQQGSIVGGFRFDHLKAKQGDPEPAKLFGQ